MVSPTGSGSGAGGTGSLGSPLSPTQREIEASAWTQVNKAALGIVRDSIDLSFAQINQRYSHSHLSTQTGYRAREDQPLLDHTLENMRIVQPNPLESKSINETYDSLVRQLPKDLLELFLNDKQKPFHERRSSFVVLDNLLMNTAELMNKVAVHHQVAPPGSLEEARTDDNLSIPKLALHHSLQTALLAAQKAQDFLEAQGANFPGFDTHHNDITEIRGAIAGLSPGFMPPQPPKDEESSP